MKRVELLAPAGDLEKLKMAVMYGADAVFVGSKEFSLRSRASNFTIDDLKEGAKFCHLHNAKLYVTTNIVAHNGDLGGLIDYLQEIEKAGVDAIICSSYSIIELAKRHTNLDIHISTQQSVTNSLGVKFYQDYGATRVVLARECSIDQIRQIKEKCDVELEVFIHGGMCSSYSGRCMLSNHMTNRDANRGGCAHSCRWNYKLYDKDDNLLSSDGFFQFASKDLQAVKVIPELIEVSDSLKIEGRMKSLHYIATVVKAYRELIDQYYLDKDKIDFNYFEEQIKKAENRIFATGFLDPKNKDIQLYNMRSEKAIQNFVGIFLGYDKEKNLATVDVRNYFDANSKLEIFSPNEKDRYFNIDTIYDKDMNVIDAARHPRDIVYIKCPFEVKEYDILRVV